MSAPTFAIEPYCDDLGPEKVLHIYEPQSGLRAIVVVDNTACGPAIGGVRLASDLSVDEVSRRPISSNSQAMHASSVPMSGAGM